MEDGTLLISDGQHRFVAAKELGVKLFYIEKTGTDVSRDIRIMHTYSRGWKDTDYLRHFVQQDVPSYVHLAGFIKKYQLSIFFGLKLLSAEYTLLKDLTSVFRIGDFYSTEGARLEGVKKATQLNEIRFVHQRLGAISKDRAFVASLLRLTEHPQYDHDRMMSVIHDQIMSFVKCSNVADYLRQLTEIYNYRLSAKNRVNFSFIENGEKR